MEKALLSINWTKSAGPNGIPSWILLDFACVLGDPFCSIFNAFTCDGYIPEEWRAADVCALPKVNPPKHVDSDLRPISLTTIISKLMESFVCIWIWDYIAEKISSDQYGYTNKTGTVHTLINLVHGWSAPTNTHHTFVRVLLLDFKKAFDHVDHTIVLCKLLDLGVHGCLVK